MKNNAWQLLLLVTVFVFAACRPSDSADTNGQRQTQTVLSVEDSARVLMERVDHYYKNLEHDSLGTLAPEAMLFFSSHQYWEEYYTTWSLLVNDLVWNGQMETGFDEAQKMHQDAIWRNSAFGLSEAYTAMGIAYHFQKDNAEAALSYQQALKHFPADANQSVKFNIYSCYCQVLVDMGDFETMKAMLDEWGEFLDQLTGGDTASTANTHRYFRYHRERFRYYYAKERFNLAASELDAMQACLDKESDREVYEAQVAGFRTQLGMARKNYAEAMEWSDREIGLCKRQDFNTFLNALKHRTVVLQTLGRYEEALRAYRSYDQHKDSLIQADARQQLNELNKRFEVDELKAWQERTELEHDRQQLQFILICAAIVVVGLALFTLFRYRVSRRLEQAHDLLAESNEQLQRSYEQLKVANARAEESSKMKSNFINQISHEIRTPLNVLSGFAQIITTPGIELDDEQKVDISKRITENTDRITQLVNRMLELSEANSKAVIERSDKVSVAQIAVQAVEESGITRAEHVQLELNLDNEAETLVLTTNLRQATRALVQLLDNAQKFPKAGIVTLTTKTSAQRVRFIVEDTGIGIPADEAEHIFDEFVQLDEYYTGTGIGLTVARNIAHRLGGDVTLDTSYTSGARFVFTLPLKA